MRTMGLNVALSDYCLMCKESRGGRACVCRQMGNNGEGKRGKEKIEERVGGE